MNTTSPAQKRPMALLLLILLGGGLTASGCAYGSIASTQDGTILIARNSLLGSLRKIYVCKLVGSTFTCVESTNAP